MAFGALILMFIIFSLLSPYFLTGSNISGILIATAVNGILAIGVTFVIITSGIDLSVGTVMTLTTVMMGKVVTDWGMPIPIGLLAGIVTGLAAGFVNGFLITKAKLPPFIATLGMLNVARGLSLVISNVKPIYFDENPAFNQIAMGVFIDLSRFIPGLVINNAVLILFGAAILASLILSKTVLGRYTFALGSNEEAARLSGVNVHRWKIAVYMLTGFFSALAGIVMASRINSAQPSLGQGYELDAIAAAVIGGTSLSGGEGSILGTVIGAFLISTLSNGLKILSVPPEWQIVVTGLIVWLAVWLDIIRRRK
ncbi:MAG: ABC transporter permease [Anaerolineae bacterium]|nr:ABC transporter permease [Anaerolineae bacterium]